MMSVDKKKGACHLLSSIGNSLAGLLSCFRDEAAFRHECFFAVPHFVLLFWLPLSIDCRMYLIALWVLLVVAELLNTSIEAVTDLAMPELHSLAKKSKDCASAAVFCVITLILGSWIVVLRGL